MDFHKFILQDLEELFQELNEMKQELKFIQGDNN